MVDFMVDGNICELENRRYDYLQEFFYLMEQQYIVGVDDVEEHNANARRLNQIVGAINELDETIADLAEEDYQNIVMQVSI